MPFKMVSDLEKECGRLSGFCGALAPKIAGSITQRWRHKLAEGQQVIDVLQLQTFLSEELEEIHQLLIVRENTHVAELAQDGAAREARDDAAAELREKLFQARHLFEGIFGPSASKKIFQEDAEVPVDPIPLYRLARRIQSNLLDPAFPLPPLRLDVGARLDVIANGLDEPLERLGGALRRLNWGLPDSGASLEAKEQGMEHLRQEVGKTARFLEDLYVLAGHAALAQRVRRSSHGQRGGGEAQAEPAEPEPPEEVSSLPEELAADDEADKTGSAAA